MNRKLLLAGLNALIAVLVVLLAASTQTFAQGPQPSAAAVNLGTGVSYQGQLRLSGAPVNATCDFIFRAFDTPSAGTQKGSTLNATIPVSNGLFARVLDFGVGVFDGDARWLDMQVRCPTGVGGFTALTPRQAFSPVPYALALPGLRTTQNLTSPNIMGGFISNTVTGSASGVVIAGGGSGQPGFTNSANADFAVISGGAGNFVSGTLGTIGGGGSNRAGGNYSTIGGGLANRATGFAATIGGGQVMSVTGSYATVAGGSNNSALKDYATIGGGLQNVASGQYATVGGGATITASGQYATVGGGTFNEATFDYATIAGGFDNEARQIYTTVGGGHHNTATGQYATIAGGNNNFATGYQSNVSGGGANFANGDYSTVGGGQIIRADGQYATVAGGTQITITGDYGSVGGGALNVISGTAATIGGGTTNRAGGNYSTVSGGLSNRATGFASTVGGGQVMSVTGAYATIAGGSTNVALADYATVGGGTQIVVTGQYATVGGGKQITATGDYASVGGGTLNRATQGYATIGGGFDNLADQIYSTVGGGHGNAAQGQYSTIGGGSNNFAHGYASTVPGGGANFADGDYSFAAGLAAHADHDGAFVWADHSGSPFSSSGDDQFLIRAAGGVGINTASPETQLHVKKSANGSGDNPADNVVVFENTNTNNSADVLALKIGGTISPTGSNNFITFLLGNNQSVGAIQGNGSNSVVLAGGGSDYAEWLLRLDPRETMQPGELVGVVGGRVTKDTRGASQVMVVSTDPIVLGNDPGGAKHDGYAPVAFIGQAPVKVRGLVRSGDLIVPSGLNDGTGIALSPERVSAQQFAQVVGQAWDSSDDANLKYVRVAVGLIQHDPTVQRLVDNNAAQTEQLAAQATQLASFEARLGAIEQSQIGLNQWWLLAAVFVAGVVLARLKK